MSMHRRYVEIKDVKRVLEAQDTNGILETGFCKLRILFLAVQIISKLVCCIILHTIQLLHNRVVKVLQSASHKDSYWNEVHA